MDVDKFSISLLNNWWPENSFILCTFLFTNFYHPQRCSVSSYTKQQTPIHSHAWTQFLYCFLPLLAAAVATAAALRQQTHTPDTINNTTQFPVVPFNPSAFFSTKKYYTFLLFYRTIRFFYLFVVLHFIFFLHKIHTQTT